jgi:hypothetical protein
MVASNHVWTEPAPGVAPKPRTYTPEQQAMIDELREVRGFFLSLLKFQLISFYCLVRQVHNATRIRSIL